MRPSQKGFLAAACAAFSGRPLPGLWGPVPGGRAGFVCLLLSSGCLSGPGVHRRIFILQGEYEAALTLYDAHVSAPVLPEFMLPVGSHCCVFWLGPSVRLESVILHGAGMLHPSRTLRAWWTLCRPRLAAVVWGLCIYRPLMLVAWIQCGSCNTALGSVILLQFFHFQNFLTSQSETLCVKFCFLSLASKAAFPLTRVCLLVSGSVLQRPALDQAEIRSLELPSCLPQEGMAHTPGPTSTACPAP